MSQTRLLAATYSEFQPLGRRLIGNTITIASTLIRLQQSPSVSGILSFIKHIFVGNSIIYLVHPHIG
jgi:hypothetical protein